MAATRYDEVTYPTALFEQTHPPRLAVLATVYGLDPPDPATARVLEIGGGDAMSVIAYAAAHPGARAHSFDLSPGAVARGRAMAAAAGLDNVTVEECDIMDAAARFAPRSFDYVIAHGVYAWVPEPVRRAILALIGHVLSDNGVAFLSFNALPGGHIRMILRDMLMHVLSGIDAPDQRIVATRAFLKDFAAARDGDEALMTAVRGHAQSMLDRPDSVLFHDELGPEYAPQQLMEVASAAAAHGLKFLADAGRNRHLDGFLADDAAGPDDADAAVLHAAQLDDYLKMRFFRQPVFVRAEARPIRRIDTDLLDDLLLSTTLGRNDQGDFTQGGDTIEIKDRALADAIAAAAAASPARVPLREIARTRDQRVAMLRLYNEWYVRLHPAPPPFALDLGERPCTSALVRAGIALGEAVVFTLDHRLLEVKQPELRALLMAADGTRTIDEIAALPDLDFPADQVPLALAAAAKRGLLAR